MKKGVNVARGTKFLVLIPNVWVKFSLRGVKLGDRRAPGTVLCENCTIFGRLASNLSFGHGPEGPDKGQKTGENGWFSFSKVGNETLTVADIAIELVTVR